MSEEKLTYDRREADLIYVLWCNDIHLLHVAVLFDIVENSKIHETDEFAFP